MPVCSLKNSIANFKYKGKLITTANFLPNVYSKHHSLSEKLKFSQLEFSWLSLISAELK